MNCNNANKKISLFIDGMLDKKGERLLMEHIDVCNDCKKLYDKMKEVKNRLSSLPEIALPEGAENRVHFALQRQTQKLKKKKWIKISVIAMPVAVAAFAAVLGVSYLFPRGISENAAMDKANGMQFEMTASSDDGSAEKTYAESTLAGENEADMLEAPMPQVAASGTMEEFEQTADEEGIRLVQVGFEFSVKVVYEGINPEEMLEFVSNFADSAENMPDQEIVFDKQTNSVRILIPNEYYNDFIDMVHNTENVTAIEGDDLQNEEYDKNLLFEVNFLFQEKK